MLRGRFGINVIIVVSASFFIHLALAGEPAASARSETTYSHDATLTSSNAGPDERYAQTPGFGGAFLDANGTPTIYVTSVRYVQEAREAASVILQGRSGDRDAAARAVSDIRVVKGRYDLDQLGRWKDEMIDVLTIPGTVFLDVDERINRLRVGIEETDVSAAVVREIKNLGIPQEAVVIEETAPIRFAATLRNRVRPTAGGLQIAFSNSLCTLGFNARRVNTTLRFATNSHCTNVQGGVEGTRYYQPLTGSSTNEIGTEFLDPAYWTGSPCPSGRRCRWSDSALGTYFAGVSVGFARIARTTGSSPSSGSITINPNNPRFIVVGEEPFPVAGELLEKIGRTTGWTFGNVVNTCVSANVIDTNITLLCQDKVAAGVDHGDSGSPVFKWLGGKNVKLYGLLWGLTADGGYLFSAIDNIEAELGALSTF